MKNNKPKLVAIDFIRAYAFLQIFLWHITHNQFVFGCQAVSTFIVLSGFLLIYNYYDRDLEYGIKQSFEFVRKKISRLYFLNIICDFLFLCLKGFSGFLIICFILHLSFTQVFIPKKTVYFSLNSVAWYLSVIFYLYLVFPFILHYIKKLKNNIYLYVLLILIVQFLLGLVVFYFKPSICSWFCYVFPFYRMGDFVIGSLFGLLFIKRYKEFSFLKGSVLEIMSILVFFVVGIIACRYKSLYPFVCYNIIFTLPSCFLIYVYSCNRGIISKIMNNAFVRYIAKISPYAFLIHFIVVKIILKSHFNTLTKILISFIITVILSEIYIHLLKLYKKGTEKSNV
ncbi:MAG: acyltransferase [Abditibacteriota bacterium]|nr:acyltransferase [Abditibacteriota bacterium]